MKKLMKTADVIAYVEDGEDVKVVELCVPYTKTRRKLSYGVKLACDGPVLKYVVKNITTKNYVMDDRLFIDLAEIMLNDSETKQDILKLVYGEPRKCFLDQANEENELISEMEDV